MGELSIVSPEFPARNAGWTSYSGSGSYSDIGDTAADGSATGPYSESGSDSLSYDFQVNATLDSGSGDAWTETGGSGSTTVSENDNDSFTAGEPSPPRPPTAA